MTIKLVHEQYNDAFLAATPDIAAEILDLSIKTPIWMADAYEILPWPSDQNTLQQLVFRGSLPEVERGFDRWKQLAQTAGCTPCLDDCSYNWSQFNGNAMERRMISLMRREFRTNEYCVNEIKSTEEYTLVFEKIMENIQMQVQFFKEMNIGLNFLTGIAKKLVVDGSGIKGNPEDPYTYRPLGTATISKLNTSVLTQIYEGMRRRSDVVPFDIVNGRPIYAISASDDIMDNLYLQDTNARQDLRFSSAADALLNKYNFMSSVRGQFINAPLLFPRRFNNVAGVLTEVFPYVNGIPAEVGSFSDLNPVWEGAQYEEVLIYGRNPFKLYYNSPVATIGAGTDFGPEPTFMDTWLWINPETPTDPFRRVGYFATSIEIAVAAQWSGGVYGLIVPRPTGASLISYDPALICPPTDPVCDNDVPEVGCPCPLILSAVINPINNRTVLQFAVPIVAEALDTIELGIGTGGSLVGTIQAISADGYFLEVTFPVGTTITDCTVFTEVVCANRLKCSSLVTNTNDCRSAQTNTFNIFTQDPIYAVVGDTIVGFMGDGTQQEFEIVAANLLNNNYVLEYTGASESTDGTAPNNADINCDRNGIVKVCVPPTTNAACPSCDVSVLTPCEEVDPVPAQLLDLNSNAASYVQGAQFAITATFDKGVVPSVGGSLAVTWTGLSGDFTIPVIANVISDTQVVYIGAVPAQAGTISIATQTIVGVITDVDALAAVKLVTAPMVVGLSFVVA